MANVTFSALINDARGKVGDVVFSIWKGRNYVRNRVTPANPRSDDQTTVRNYMAITVAWWSLLSVALKAACGLLAASESISGFNGFTKRCMRDMNATPTPVKPRFVPLNTDVPAVTELAGEAGTGVGTMDLTWVDPATDAGDTVEIYACKHNDGDFDAVLENVTGTPTLASAEAKTITVTEANIEYDVFVLIKTDDAVPEYSLAVNCEAYSSES